MVHDPSVIVLGNERDLAEAIGLLRACKESIYMIAENTGVDGNVTAAAYEGDTLLASKFVSVKGGSFCVVPMTVTLEGAGEHTITAGDQSLTVTVE